MTATTATTTPAASRWYRQAGGVDVARRLESLGSLHPVPPPVGIITADRDEVTATFVSALKGPLPHPWLSADIASEARIAWDAVGGIDAIDPDHPVYLVAFGTREDGALIGLNLGVLNRIRVGGDTATVVAVIQRWILELLTTHPTTTIGVTTDVWAGPWTSRVHRVEVGHVPPVNVLVAGPELTYSDRAQIVSHASSPVIIDLGQDAAVDTKWVITCGGDQVGQISNGSAGSMTATLLRSSPAAIERCHALMTDPPATADPAITEPAPTDDALPAFPDGDEQADDPTEPVDDDVDGAEAGVDFFADPIGTTPAEPSAIWPADQLADQLADTPAPLQPAAHAPPTTAIDGQDDPEDPAATEPESAAQPQAAPAAADTTTPAIAPTTEPTGPLQQPPPPHPDITPAPAASAPVSPPLAPLPQMSTPPSTPPAASVEAPITAAARPTPADEVSQLAPIWNRILGQVALDPPNPGQPPGVREKRLNELTVYLQYNPWASTDDIIRCVYNGAASEKTVTQQVSLLRARLGVVRIGGPKALPPMRDGSYRLDTAVRSDWMEFERLVEIVIETTSTPNLLTAMQLVTGPPLGGVPPREWSWTTDLRAELRDRVGGVAAALGRRLLEDRQFSSAVEISRKGLWYDPVRQDVWQTALKAAAAAHDQDTFKRLRTQYFNAVELADRDPAVLELTRQGG